MLQVSGSRIFSSRAEFVFAGYLGNVKRFVEMPRNHCKIRLALTDRFSRRRTDWHWCGRTRHSTHRCMHVSRQKQPRLTPQKILYLQPILSYSYACQERPRCAETEQISIHPMLDEMDNRAGGVVPSPAPVVSDMPTSTRQQGNSSQLAGWQWRY